MDLGTADKEGASLLQSCLVAFSWEEDHDKQAANYHVRPTKNIIGLYIQIIDKMLVIGPRVSCCLHLYLDGRIPPSTCLAWINKLHISLLEVQRRRAAVQEPATRSHRSQPRFAVVPLETVAIRLRHERSSCRSYWRGRGFGTHMADDSSLAHHSLGLFRCNWHRSGRRVIRLRAASGRAGEVGCPPGQVGVQRGHPADAIARTESGTQSSHQELTVRSSISPVIARSQVASLAHAPGPSPYRCRGQPHDSRRSMAPMACSHEQL
jgi:hypothetical protein